MAKRKRMLSTARKTPSELVQRLPAKLWQWPRWSRFQLQPAPEPRPLRRQRTQRPTRQRTVITEILQRLS